MQKRRVGDQAVAGPAHKRLGCCWRRARLFEPVERRGQRNAIVTQTIVYITHAFASLSAREVRGTHKSSTLRAAIEFCRNLSMHNLIERNIDSVIRAGDDSAPIFIVLGMHRSGTSLCASMLNCLGVNIAEDIGVGNGNDRGHFERWDLVEIHDKILKQPEIY